MGRGLGPTQQKILEILDGCDTKWYTLDELVFAIHPETTTKDLSYRKQKQNEIYRAIYRLVRRENPYLIIRRRHQTESKRVWVYRKFRELADKTIEPLFKNEDYQKPIKFFD